VSWVGFLWPSSDESLRATLYRAFQFPGNPRTELQVLVGEMGRCERGGERWMEWQDVDDDGMTEVGRTYAKLAAGTYWTGLAKTPSQMKFSFGCNARTVYMITRSAGLGLD